MEQQGEQQTKSSKRQLQQSEYNNVWVSKREWRSFKRGFLELAPYYAIAFIIFVLGYLTGIHVKGQEIVMDCKYANSFRVSTDSFDCRRKL